MNISVVFNLVFALTNFKEGRVATYGDSVYVFYPNTVSSIALAKDYCLGSNLLDIKDENTQNFLKQELNIQYNNTPDNITYGILTGGGRDANQDLWQWENGKLFFHQSLFQAVNGAFNSWIRTEGRIEPDQDHLSVTPCSKLVMLPGKWGWNWADLRCDETDYSLYPVCQTKMDNYMMLITDQEIVTANKGDSIYIKISLNKNLENYKFEITKKNIEPKLHSLDLVEITQTHFAIEHASYGHNGEYSIKVSNNNSITTHTKFVINVNDISDINILRSTLIGEGNNQTEYIDCIAKGFPKPILNWEQTDEKKCQLSDDIAHRVNATIYEVTTNDAYTTQLRMIFISSDIKNYGTYTCTASHGEVTKSKSTTLYGSYIDELLRINVEVSINYQSSVTIEWSHQTKVEKYGIIYELRLQAAPNGCNKTVKNIEFPVNSQTFSDLCENTLYNYQVITTILSCKYANSTTQGDFKTGTSQGFYIGNIASILLAFLLLCVMMITGFYVKKTRRSKQYIVNWFNALRKPSSAKLDNGYVAAAENHAGIEGIYSVASESPIRHVTEHGQTPRASAYLTMRSSQLLPQVCLYSTVEQSNSGSFGRENVNKYEM